MRVYVCVDLQNTPRALDHTIWKPAVSKPMSPLAHDSWLALTGFECSMHLTLLAAANAQEARREKTEEDCVNPWETVCRDLELYAFVTLCLPSCKMINYTTALLNILFW